jgi:hypothetical protein
VLTRYGRLWRVLARFVITNGVDTVRRGRLQVIPAFRIILRYGSAGRTVARRRRVLQRSDTFALAPFPDI